MKRDNKTDPQARLERAISYWLEHEPIATIEQIKRVANRFGVAWKDLETAIKLRSELEDEERADQG